MIRRLARPAVLGALLALSVAVNLFLGGLIAGRLTGQASQAVQAKRNLDEALAPLAEDKRAAVRKELRAALPEVRRNFQAMQQARAALAEEFVRPQPDPAALDRHFAEVRARTAAMQDALQQSFKRGAANLTQAERRAVIEAMKRRAPRGGVPEV